MKTIAVGQETLGIEMRKLGEVKAVRFQEKLAVLLVATASLIALSLTLPGIAWLVPSLLLGLAYAHAVELQHQCLHNTAYRRKAINRLVGVPLGLPTCVSFSDYQNSHLKHHRLLGTSEDKEFFNYSYQKLRSPLALIPHLWMVRHYWDVLGYICKSSVGILTRKNEATPKTAAKIRSEYQLMAVFIGAMAVLTVVFATPIFVEIWLIPLLVAVPVHALIELPEHIGCNTKVPNVLENTRTINTNKLVTWFVDGNNYHVEHHWLPGVPNDKFPLLHNHLKGKIAYNDTSYRSFYKQFVQHLKARTLDRTWEVESTAVEARKAVGTGA
jgi:fatty acid desaturase